MRSHDRALAASLLLTAVALVAGCAATSPEPVSITGDPPNLTAREPAKAGGGDAGSDRRDGAGGGGAAPGPGAGAGAGAVAGAGAGSIVGFPSDINGYSPADSNPVHVDASTVNLREVFEELGTDAIEWYQHVQTLSDPFFEGRVPGSRGAELTDDYIEHYFRQYRLEPAFDGSFRQPFTFPARTPPTIHRAAMSLGGRALADGRDFAVLGPSAKGEVTGPITFVGYGIARGPDEYSSFLEETDLSGRIALVLSGAPMGEDDQALWEARQVRQIASIGRKVRSLSERGAVAIIVVDPPGSGADRPALETLEASSRGSRGAASVPVVQITTAQAEALMARAGEGGRDLRAWRRLADRGAITTVALPDDVTASISVDLERAGIDAANVAGVLRGRGSLAEEWIIIGAHQDHLGTGHLGGANADNRGQLHPGADDNASGTAGVLILARRFAEAYDDVPASRHLRSILFVAFDAEELGLLGSRHLTEHLPMPAGTVSLMLNMDMIGRMSGGNLSILGAGTGEGLTDLMRTRIEASGLTVALNEAGSGRSDDANFHRIQVPAVHFFTGMRPEYHSPQDLAYTVNPAGATQVLDLLFEIAWDVATRPQKLVFHEPPRAAGGGRSYGPVSLGLRPAMDEAADGVVVESVFEGGSAALAGIREGDVIIAWADHPIEGPRALPEHYRDHKPGDVVKLTIERDGERIVLDVTLQAPRQR